MAKKKHKKKQVEKKETGASVPENQTPERTFAKERKFWIIVSGLFFVVGVVSGIYALTLQPKLDNYDRNLVNCSMELDEAVFLMGEMEKEVNKMKYQVEKSKLVDQGESFLPEEFMSDLKKKGLGSPIHNLSLDLYGRKDIIPYAPISGRELRITNRDDIFILSPNRAFAVFSDGTNNGWLLLSYKVAEKTQITSESQITWKILESHCPYYDK